MKRKTIKVGLLVLTFLLLLSGCASMSPRNRTILLSEPEKNEAEVQEESGLSEGTFEVKKISRISMDKLDPDGIHPDIGKAVVDWMDEDNLFAMSVQHSTVEDSALPDNGATQQSTRVLTQFASLNYQYGFYDPILTLADVEAECYDLSDDGKYVACVVGSQLMVYDLTSGTLKRSVDRDVLAPIVTFETGSSRVYFTSGGESKKLEALDVDSGVITTVQEGKTYRALAADSSRRLMVVVTQGTDVVSYCENSILQESVLTGEKSGASALLPGGGALLCYGDDLYRLSTEGAQIVKENVNAFSLASDGTHICYASLTDSGATNVYIGRWSGSSIVEEKLVYKELNMTIEYLLFSPDLCKLYLQGSEASGDAGAYTFAFK